MGASNAVILERDKELAALAAAIAGAAAGRGSFVLVEGPAGIGKTTLLRAASTVRGPAGVQVLTARGLALERDFPYGIARQLIEPVRAATPPADWAGFLEGAAGLATRVFDWTDVPSVEDDTQYATTHGLYWLIANLAMRRPLVIAVDDVHWADGPSLRWLAHLAERIEDLPAALLLAARTAPDEPAMVADLRASRACQLYRLAPLGQEAAAALVRQRLGAEAADDLCLACHASTGGNPFLLGSLVTALRQLDAQAGDLVSAVATLGPGQVATSVLRRVGQFGDAAAQLTRALAVFGGPALLRHASALAGLPIADAAQAADRLRAADVLAPGSVLEFAHPIVRAAVYESIPPGERALAHATAARLLDEEGANAERTAPHLLRSEPASDPRVVNLLREAARAAGGRGSPATAARYLRRALDEPPDAGSRPAVLLELGLSLAGDRSPAASDALSEAVRLAADSADPAEHAAAAVQSAGVLGIWGHHSAVTQICAEALAAGPGLDQATRDSLQAEALVNTMIDATTAGQALAAAERRLADRDAPNYWQVPAALVAALRAQPPDEARDRLARVFATGMADIAPDSLIAAYSLLALIWSDDLGTAGRVCEAVLHAARERGSMSMVAHLSCLRSIIARRQGQLEDAAADARLALDFKLATSPPLAVAWAAGLSIDALTCLGRLGEADEIAAVTQQREPADGWIHTTVFRQARGGLRAAQHRFDDALADLAAAARGWAALGVTNPAVASWRSGAVTAHAAMGDMAQAAALACEQLELARQVGTPRAVGTALVAYAAAVPGQALASLTGAAGLLETAGARYDLAGALLELGALLRRSGRPKDARAPLMRAQDLARRTSATRLEGLARHELLAAGARPRRIALTGPEALTSAERRVAGLAAAGLSNRQIAQHLFVTLATVETHLRHAFAKLGITSRAELPPLLASDEPAAQPSALAEPTAPA